MAREPISSEDASITAGLVEFVVGVTGQPVGTLRESDLLRVVAEVLHQADAVLLSNPSGRGDVLLNQALREGAFRRWGEFQVLSPDVAAAAARYYLELNLFAGAHQGALEMGPSPHPEWLESRLAAERAEALRGYLAEGPATPNKLRNLLGPSLGRAMRTSLTEWGSVSYRAPDGFDAADAATAAQVYAGNWTPRAPDFKVLPVTALETVATWLPHHLAAGLAQRHMTHVMTGSALQWRRQIEGALFAPIPPASEGTTAQLGVEATARFIRAIEARDAVEGQLPGTPRVLAAVRAVRASVNAIERQPFNVGYGNRLAMSLAEMADSAGNSGLEFANSTVAALRERPAMERGGATLGTSSPVSQIWRGQTAPTIGQRQGTSLEG